MRIAWKATAIAVVLAATLAACGNGDDDGVATIGGSDTGSGSTASPSVDPEDALAEFAECMRENGIEDFPDPQIGEDGGIQIGAGGDGGPPTEEDRQAIDDAMAVCEDLLPQGEGPGEISEEDQAAAQDAAVEFAECMREHGIEEFPDPEFSDDGGILQQIGDNVDPSSDEFREAEDACRSVLEDALPGRGEGGEVSTDEAP
jgi:hypothetical protein